MKDTEKCYWMVAQGGGGGGGGGISYFFRQETSQLVWDV